MKTYGERIAEGPSSLRYFMLFGLTGSGGLIALLTGMSRGAGTFLAICIFLAFESFVWLRNNPTLKQIEKRRQHANDKAGVDEDVAKPGPNDKPQVDPATDRNPGNDTS